MGFTHWLSERFSTPEEQMARLRHEGEAWADRLTEYLPKADAHDEIRFAQLSDPSIRDLPVEEVKSILQPGEFEGDPSVRKYIRPFMLLRADCAAFVKPNVLPDLPVERDAKVDLVEFKPSWTDFDPKRYARLDLQITEAYEDRAFGGNAAVAGIQPQPPSGGGGIGKRVEDATTMRFMP